MQLNTNTVSGRSTVHMQLNTNTVSGRSTVHMQLNTNTVSGRSTVHMQLNNFFCWPSSSLSSSSSSSSSSNPFTPLEHRASMKSFQALRSPAIPLTSFHDLLVLLISPSVVLRHVLFGLPLLLYPWGFQSNAVSSIAPVSLRNVCPIQFRFLLFIWFSIDFWSVILHSSSFVILLVYFIFIICLKHLFTNICSLLVIWLVIFQVSQAYNNNDFTYVLNSVVHGNW